MSQRAAEEKRPYADDDSSRERGHFSAALRDKPIQLADQVPTTVILVGVGGFGAVHLNNILRLQTNERIRLIALVDPIVKARPGDTPLRTSAPLFNTLTEAIIAVGSPSVVVVAVPIHLHASVAREALQAGADVLLEKPPFANLSDFEELLTLEKDTGRVVQVGFQSLGSLGLDAIASDQFGLGQLRAVRATGIWVRAKWYWERSNWVGRRSIGEVDVVDGVATNALAHAVITALHVAGLKHAENVQSVEVEMYRANPIDADDTTSIRITQVKGPSVTANLTLAGGERRPVNVEIIGTTGSASFQFETDDVYVHPAKQNAVNHYDRIDLLENLLAYRREGTPLRVPLRDTGAFMRVLEAIRKGGEPTHIEKRWVEKRGTGSEAFAVVHDIERWIDVAASKDCLFSEAGAPWAFNLHDQVITRADIDGSPILQVLDGLGTTPSSSPRPYIHPITTLGGVEVTATHPADHDWHLGLGVAIPDVNGISFWGGPTYVRDKGYVPLENHGTMTNVGLQYIHSVDKHQADGLKHSILWRSPSGGDVVHEVRTLHWSRLSTASGFQFHFQSSLTAVSQSVSLGSPGTNGRDNAGYGGFFWRLPRCTNVDILSATGEGEDVVHGSVSPWLSWSANFESRPGATGPATLIVIPDDKASRDDPWIVRCAGYPGIGSAIAWKDRVHIPGKATIVRSFLCAVVDGRLERGAITDVIDGLRGPS